MSHLPPESCSFFRSLDSLSPIALSNFKEFQFQQHYTWHSLAKRKFGIAQKKISDWCHDDVVGFLAHGPIVRHYIRGEGVYHFSPRVESSCYSGRKVRCSCSNLRFLLNVFVTTAVGACRDFARTHRHEASFSWQLGLKSKNIGQGQSTLCRRVTSCMLTCEGMQVASRSFAIPVLSDHDLVSQSDTLNNF